MSVSVSGDSWERHASALSYLEHDGLPKMVKQMEMDGKIVSSPTVRKKIKRPCQPRMT